MYTNDSEEALLPRFSVDLRRDKNDFERVSLKDGRYTFESYPDALNKWGRPACNAIKQEGGEIREDLNDAENLIVLLPSGTTVNEYNVPRARNTENYIASDVVIYLPSGKVLVFEQNGYQDSMWVATGETLRDIIERSRV